jgi:hypothetical protein
MATATKGISRLALWRLARRTGHASVAALILLASILSSDALLGAGAPGWASASPVFADGSVRVGAQARVTSGLNVRDCASTSCRIVGGLSSGDIVSIDGGPQYGSGYKWWHHNRGGWSIDNNLTYYQAPQSQPQPRPQPQPGPPPQPQPNSGGSPAGNGWTYCADEGGRCNFSGTADVWYGAGSRSTTKSFANGVDCNNDNLGPDPAYGTRKSCYYKVTSSPALNQTRLNLISALYKSVLGRPADYPGLMAYYNSGQSSDWIRNSMLASVECALGNGGECRARKYDGAIVQASGDGASWLLSGLQRHAIPDTGIFWTLYFMPGHPYYNNPYWTHDQVYNIPQGSPATAPVYGPQDEGAVVTGPSSATDPTLHSYQLTGNQRHEIPDQATYYYVLNNPQSIARGRAYTWGWDRIKRVPVGPMVPRYVPTAGHVLFQTSPVGDARVLSLPRYDGRKGQYEGSIRTIRDHIVQLGCLMIDFTMLLQDAGRNVSITDLYAANYELKMHQPFSQAVAQGYVVIPNLNAEGGLIGRVAPGLTLSKGTLSGNTDNLVQQSLRSALTAYGSGLIVHVYSGTNDGHYVIVDSYNSTNNTFNIRDPNSNTGRTVGTIGLSSGNAYALAADRVFEYIHR